MYLPRLVSLFTLSSVFAFGADISSTDSQGIGTFRKAMQSGDASVSTSVSGTTKLQLDVAIANSDLTWDLGGQAFTVDLDTSAEDKKIINSGTFTINTDTNNSAATINAPITGVGALTKTGAHTLTLGGSQTYAGVTNINGGTLALASNATLSGTPTININGTESTPAQFSVGTATVPQTPQINMGSYSALSIGSGKLFTVSGVASVDNEVGSEIQMNGDGILLVDTGESGDTTYKGQITGTGKLVVQGSNSFTITNPNNVYSGGTALFTGTLNVAAAALPGDINGDPSVGDTTPILNFNQASDNGTYPGVINGNVDVKVSGKNANIIFSGDNTYTNNTSVSNGAILSIHGELSSKTINIDEGGLEIYEQGVLKSKPVISMADDTGFTLYNSATVGGIEAQNTGVGIKVYVQIAGAILTIDSDDDSRLTPGIAGVGSLTKSGKGELKLYGTSSYSGSTKVMGGQLTIGSGANLSETSHIEIGDQTTFEIDQNGLLTSSPPVSIGDHASFIVGENVIITGLDDLAVGQSGHNVNANRLLTVDIGEGQSSTFSGHFSGDLTKTGQGILTLSGGVDFGIETDLFGGTLTLSGSGNTFDTTFNISNATLNLQGANSTTETLRVAMGANSELNVEDNILLSNLDMYDGATGESSNVNISTGKSLEISIFEGSLSTYQGNVKGAGSLVKSGEGTLYLYGQNSATGGLSLNNGKLSTQWVDALGQGTVTHGGGTLELTGSTTDALAHTFTQPSTISVMGTEVYKVTGAFTVDGSVTDPSPLTLSGGGNFEMGASVGYPSEKITVTYGSLKVVPGSLTYSNPIIVLSTPADSPNSSFSMDVGSDQAPYTWDGMETGLGDFHKTGGGVLRLTQVSSGLTGALYVDKGALDASGMTSNPFPNASSTYVADGATYTGSKQFKVFNPSGLGKIEGAPDGQTELACHVESLFEGTLHGEGHWVKTGNAKLALTGMHSATGPFKVAEGNLANNGDLTSHNAITVASNATLSGTGTNPSTVVKSGGTYGSGNSIGSSTVAGDLTFENGAIHEVEYDSSTSDLTTVTGTLNLNDGSILYLSAVPGTKTRLNEKQTFLLSDEHAGEFTIVKVDNSNDMMKRNVAVVYTPATTLDGVSMIDLLFGLRSPQKFDTRMLSLASEISKQIDDYQMANVRDQILSGVIDEECPVPVRYKPFAIYNHRDGGFEGHEDGTPSHFRLDGLTTGVQADVYKHLGVGAAYGYTNSTIKADHNWGKINTNSHSAIAFINAGCLNNFNLDGEYISTWTSFDSDRLDTDGSHSTAKYNGWEQSGNIRGIYDYQVKSVHILPTLGVRYVYFSIDGYTESGNADESLTVKKDHASQLYTDLGLTLTRPIHVKKYKLTPQLGFIWSHQYLNDGRTLAVALNEDHDEAAFMPIERSESDVGIVNLGLDFSNEKGLSAYVNLDTIFSKTSRFTWDTRVGLQMTF